MSLKSFVVERADRSTAGDVLVHQLWAIDELQLARRREPVTVGLPLAKGVCSLDRSHLRLIAADGRWMPIQTRVLDRWSDGSVRWMLIDFQADSGSDEARPYRLYTASGALPPPVHDIAVVEEREAIVLDTGAARFRLPRCGPFPFADIRIDGQAALDGSGTRLLLERSDGAVYEAHTTTVALEDDGPLRAAIRLEGEIGEVEGKPLLQITARLHFFAGLSTVRFDLTVTNPRRAAHPGGFWQLGDRGSVHFRDLALCFAVPRGSTPARIRCSPEVGAPFDPVAAPLDLYQDSSGGENWRSSNHVNRHGEIAVRFRGYRLRHAETEVAGLRATPLVSVERGDCSRVIGVPQFWQNFPKAIEASADSITLRLFPRHYADTHEIQGGEQKTHTFFVCFGRDTVTDVPLAWSRAPLLVRAESPSYCSTGAVPYLTPAADDPHRDYLSLVNAAIEGEDAFEQKRERADEYGWRHYGDLPADHETAFEIGAGPVRASHYNNQYDAVAGVAYQFLRSGDRRWWDQLVDLAAHVVDIDIYHTDRDKAAYNGGLFWHTAHYVDAGTSTHRAYPRSAGVSGGGPSCEHNYSTGLMLHYFLTGNRSSRDAVVGLGEWVIAMDDGRRSRFKWLASGPTGLASATASYAYHGPGRGAGNSINVLLDAYRLSGEARFLTKAEELIRRCVHPLDDIPALELGDAERRWSYTVFLQSLGKYLDEKIECGELDERYSYARESLLAYARWMADHERPYLEKPEILEYPTETWAAQDMRKSEVFLHAAKHARDEDRSCFLDRAAFFFHASTTTLLGMRTHSFTRPVVLLLSNGFMHADFARRTETAAPQPADVHRFGPKAPFVPQKARARRNVSIAMAAASVATLGGLAAVWLF